MNPKLQKSSRPVGQKGETQEVGEHKKNEVPTNAGQRGDTPERVARAV